MATRHGTRPVNTFITRTAEYGKSALTVQVKSALPLIVHLQTRRYRVKQGSYMDPVLYKCKNMIHHVPVKRFDNTLISGLHKFLLFHNNDDSQSEISCISLSKLSRFRIIISCSFSLAIPATDALSTLEENFISF